jgi:hypothetical protein
MTDSQTAPQTGVPYQEIDSSNANYANNNDL